MIYHVCLDIRGALTNWPKKKFNKMLVNNETGKYLTASEAKEQLLQWLSEGKEVLPMSKCDNFDYKKGCQGHPSNQ